jgi:hypothetical protein
MTRINIKVNISNLKCVTQWQKGETGPVECLIIPIDANFLFKGKNGYWLDLTAFQIQHPKDNQKDTHILKQSLPKEVYETLTDEEKKAMPIMGNAMVVEVQGTNQPKPLEIDDTIPY